MRAGLPGRLSYKDVESTFRNDISDKSLEQKFRKGKDYVISEISFNNSLLYTILFDLNEQDAEETSNQFSGQRDLETHHEKTEEWNTASFDKRERLNFPATGNGKPRVVIIVDDMGFNKDSVDRLLEMEAPMNFAILPYQPYSRYAAEKAHQRGWDVILHLPMEPKSASGYGDGDVGGGVLLERLPKKEIMKDPSRQYFGSPVCHRGK